jgi:hypothetical protein
MFLDTAVLFVKAGKSTPKNSSRALARQPDLHHGSRGDGRMEMGLGLLDLAAVRSD